LKIPITPERDRGSNEKGENEKEKNKGEEVTATRKEGFLIVTKTNESARAVIGGRSDDPNIFS